MPHLFLLSPAYCGGERARLLLRDQARFPLAEQLRSPQGAPLGEVFSFISGLYFRGKLAYAAAFADPPPGWPAALVITPGAGLRLTDTSIDSAGLRAIASVEVDAGSARYRDPFERDTRQLADLLDPACSFVLLGSVASDKYVDILTTVFGPRLLFPVDFVGRGDMSRGGLMLRHARQGTPLEYAPVLGAIRRGRRPARLPPTQDWSQAKQGKCQK